MSKNIRKFELIIYNLILISFLIVICFSGLLLKNEFELQHEREKQLIIYSNSMNNYTNYLEYKIKSNYYNDSISINSDNVTNEIIYSNITRLKTIYVDSPIEEFNYKYKINKLVDIYLSPFKKLQGAIENIIQDIIYMGD